MKGKGDRRGAREFSSDVNGNSPNATDQNPLKSTKRMKHEIRTILWVIEFQGTKLGDVFKRKSFDDVQRCSAARLVSDQSACGIGGGKSAVFSGLTLHLQSTPVASPTFHHGTKRFG